MIMQDAGNVVNSADWVEIVVLSLTGAVSYGIIVYVLDMAVVRRIIHLGRKALGIAA
jgi:hypothetical protein